MIACCRRGVRFVAQREKGAATECDSLNEGRFAAKVRHPLPGYSVCGKMRRVCTSGGVWFDSDESSVPVSHTTKAIVKGYVDGASSPPNAIGRSISCLANTYKQTSAKGD